MKLKASIRTKLNIFFIALKLLLCVALMSSSTFALFTDSAELGVSVTAGGMDVRLLQWVPDEYIDISRRQGDVFGTQLWEPGHTRVVFLKVENGSNIPIKYLLEMNSVRTNGFADALEYCVLESAVFDTAGLSWAELSEGRPVYTLVDGTNPISGGFYLPLDVNGEAYFTLVMHMKEADSDVYQGKADLSEACLVNIHLFAVQGNADV